MNSRPLSFANRVKADLIQQIVAEMESLPAKPPATKTELSTKETVAQLYDTIMAKLKSGYTHEDICDLLSQKLGFSIAVGTLTIYMRKERQRREADQKHQRSKRRSNTANLRPAHLGQGPPAGRMPADPPQPAGGTLIQNSVPQQPLSEDFPLEDFVALLTRVPPAESQVTAPADEPASKPAWNEEGWREPEFNRNRVRPQPTTARGEGNEQSQQ